MSIHRLISFYLVRRCFSYSPVGKSVISALDDGTIEEITSFVKSKSDKLFSQKPVITCMNNSCINMINRHNF